ncbi:MAG: SCO family protein [Betaproteobacteria bacterium]|nr:SCO family protein [Betaproteobacteria bacterium]
MSRRRIFQLFVVLSTLAILGGLLLSLALPRIFPSKAPEEDLGGRFPNLASRPTGGDFVLHSADGPVALSDYRGKVVLLYFGYAYCPDICPTSLAVLAQTFNDLPSPARNKVQGIFISVDPGRDTPAYLKEYVSFFHPLLVGVTGSTEEIAAVAQRYGVIYRIHPHDAEDRYVVDHSSLIYLIAPDGHLATALPYGVSAEEIHTALQPFLEKTGQKAS